MSQLVAICQIPLPVTDQVLISNTIVGIDATKHHWKLAFRKLEGKTNDNELADDYEIYKTMIFTNKNKCNKYYFESLSQLNYSRK